MVDVINIWSYRLWFNLLYRPNSLKIEKILKKLIRQFVYCNNGVKNVNAGSGHNALSFIIKKKTMTFYAHFLENNEGM